MDCFKEEALSREQMGTHTKEDGRMERRRGKAMRHYRVEKYSREISRRENEWEKEL